MQINVLIADDEQLERKYLRQILSNYPYEYFVVGEAKNGKQAIELALDFKPDVVIMDVSMPVINGLEASRIIKKNSADTVIILNSAYSEFEFAKKALQYHLDAYLLKPASEEEITSTIESSLKKHKQSSMAMSQNMRFDSNFKNYPNESLENILTSIKTCDIGILEENNQKFLREMNSSFKDVAGYRLFLINAYFSIIKCLNQRVENDPALLNVEHYFSGLLGTQNWEELFKNTRDFFRYVELVIKSNSTSPKNIVHLIEEFILDHFSEDISLETLAETFHFSSNYLSRKFHKEYGVTIHDFIQKTRMNNAQFLLESSHLPVSEVALQSGFNNVSHFNRVFKLMNGKTPSQYRKERSR